MEQTVKIPQSLFDRMKQLDGQRPIQDKPDNALHNCLHCGNPLDYKQKMFCSADCFKINRFYRMDKHQYGKVTGKGGNTRNSMKYLKRSCEYCGTEFRPLSHREYMCSPQCKILAKTKR